MVLSRASRSVTSDAAESSSRRRSTTTVSVIATRSKRRERSESVADVAVVSELDLDLFG